LSALKVILLTVTKGSKNIPTVSTISTGLSGHVLLKSKYKKILYEHVIKLREKLCYYII